MKAQRKPLALHPLAYVWSAFMANAGYDASKPHGARNREQKCDKVCCRFVAQGADDESATDSDITPARAARRRRHGHKGSTS